MRHALEHLQFGLDSSPSQLAVGQHGQAQE
jgi:hypothetical protein